MKSNERFYLFWKFLYNHQSIIELYTIYNINIYLDSLSYIGFAEGSVIFESHH